MLRDPHDSANMPLLSKGQAASSPGKTRGKGFDEEGTQLSLGAMYEVWCMVQCSILVPSCTMMGWAGPTVEHSLRCTDEGLCAYT